jgi:hypothetical protein
LGRPFSSPCARAFVRTFLGASFLIAACAAPSANEPSTQDPSTAPEGTSEATTPAVAESPPAAPASDDPLAAHLPVGLKAAPWTLKDGMDHFEDLHAEENLEAWAKSPPADTTPVARLAATALAVAERVDWTTAKKRPKNPTDFDHHVDEMRTHARQLGLAALAGDPGLIAARSDRLIQRCVDCHLAYK